jgi:ribosomal protein S18 acetylase RimI-like enzyme
MTQASCAVAAATLAAALIADPFYQAISADCGKDEEHRSGLLERYFRDALEEAMESGRCVIHEDPALGAAIWHLPRAPQIEAAQSAAKLRRLSTLLSARGLDNYRRIIDFMSRESRQLVPSDAWYLSIIGVHPAAQGRRVGGMLLEPTLAEADAQRAYAFLETFTPRTARFYERVGFKQIAQRLEPVTGAPYLIMGRDVPPPASKIERTPR